MALNSKSRAALFEKLKMAGKLKPLVPGVGNPMKPQPVQGSPMANPNMVNENLIGNAKPMRFKKLKSFLG